MPAFPVVWMLSSSFKSNTEIFAYPPRLIGESSSFGAYIAVVTNPEKVRFFINSYLISTLVTLSTLIVGILAGYSFSRYQFRGSRSRSTCSSSACRRCRRLRC